MKLFNINSPFILGCIVVLVFLSAVVKPVTALSQGRNVSVSGTIIDAQSNEVLVGASVVNIKTGNGTTTNAYGHYTLWLPQGIDSVDVYFSHIGYSPLQITLPHKEQVANIQLIPSAHSIGEVKVFSKKSALKPEMSVFKLNTKQLAGLPSFAGEKDMLLYYQLAPATQLAGDGNSNLYVRGGSHDQNLFLLDELPLYHVTHLGGFTSTFNSDIVKDATFYVGAFPARYGGRLSSVVDVHTLDGDMAEHSQSVTLGMLTSKILAHGPIVKGKASYLVSLRKNTIPFLRWIFMVDENYSMYDMNVKLNTCLSDKGRLFFSFYNGNDKLGVITKDDESVNSSITNQWGNLGAALRFNRIVNSRNYLNITVGTTAYSYSELSNIDVKTLGNYAVESSFKSSVRDNFFNINFDYRASSKVAVLLGCALVSHRYNPGQTTIKQLVDDANEVAPTVKGYTITNALSPSAYGEFILSNYYGFGLNIGVRAQRLIYKDDVFNFIEPRILLSRKITSNTSLKGAYSVMHQHFHLVSNNSAGMPTDYRIPAGAFAPPSSSQIWSLGLSHVAYDGFYEFTLETFHKIFSNLADLKEGVSYVLGNDLTKVLATNGKGNAMGIELMLQKLKGSSTGWLSIGVSEANRQFKDINNGNEFPFRYDRLVNVSMLYNQQLNEKVNLIFTWVFGTGLPYSLPSEQYKDNEGSFVFIYDGINNYRDRSYHRADIGLSYTQLHKGWVGVWDFSIINIYNRKNPCFYFTRYHNDTPNLYRFSLFPIMPAISYTFKF